MVSLPIKTIMYLLHIAAVMFVPILTICCAVHNKEVQWTPCSDVTEQPGNLPKTVNCKTVLHKQTATVAV